MCTEQRSAIYLPLDNPPLPKGEANGLTAFETGSKGRVKYEHRCARVWKYQKLAV